MFVRRRRIGVKQLPRGVSLHGHGGQGGTETVVEIATQLATPFLARGDDAPARFLQVG